MTLGRRTGGLLTVVGMIVALTVPPATADTDQQWRTLLGRAAHAAENRAYIGESIWVVHDGGEASVSTFLVQSSGSGEISVADRTRYAVRLGDDGSALADHERGWFLPLPAADLSKSSKGLDRIAEKYDVEITGAERLLHRPCTRLELRRRSDGRLAERLWVDDASGLLLRRETYAGEEQLLRMVAYNKLDLDPAALTRSGQPTRPSRGQRTSQVRREQAVTEVDETGRTALREAGWLVPDAMPAQYQWEGAFALSAGDTQPLQTVYSDGLYTVSLFEHHGVGLDLEALPEGAELSDRLGFAAWTWPGAVPQRLVWEAEGTTWSLVGDAPPDELAAMAAQLPHPSSDGVLARILRGLGRLWSWVSPWS